jgi:hypothetical protein
MLSFHFPGERAARLECLSALTNNKVVYTAKSQNRSDQKNTHHTAIAILVKSKNKKEEPLTF